MTADSGPNTAILLRAAEEFRYCAKQASVRATEVMHQVWLATKAEANAANAEEAEICRIIARLHRRSEKVYLAEVERAEADAVWCTRRVAEIPSKLG